MTDESERYRWLESTTDFEKHLLIGFLLGWDLDVFDACRDFVERVRTGKAAAS